MAEGVTVRQPNPNGVIIGLVEQSLECHLLVVVVGVGDTSELHIWILGTELGQVVQLPRVQVRRSPGPEHIAELVDEDVNTPSRLRTDGVVRVGDYDVNLTLDANECVLRASRGRRWKVRIRDVLPLRQTGTSSEEVRSDVEVVQCRVRESDAACVVYEGGFIGVVASEVLQPC